MSEEQIRPSTRDADRQRGENALDEHGMIHSAKLWSGESTFFVSTYDAGLTIGQLLRRVDEQQAALAEKDRQIADYQNHVGKMAAEAECLQIQIVDLQRWVDDLQSGMYINCVYCGHRYGPRESTPVSMADVLKAHVEQCPKHPMSYLKKENARLTANNLDAAKQLAALAAEREKLRKLVADIMEHREYSGCWHSNDDCGDCGNWPTCSPDCSLRQLMDIVGIVPQEDGGLDK